jgi:hypothetical protein
MHAGLLGYDRYWEEEEDSRISCHFTPPRSPLWFLVASCVLCPLAASSAVHAMARGHVFFTGCVCSRAIELNLPPAAAAAAAALVAKTIMPQPWL